MFSVNVCSVWCSEIWIFCLCGLVDRLYTGRIIWWLCGYFVCVFVICIWQFMYMELSFVLHKSTTFTQFNTRAINWWNVTNVGQEWQLKRSIIWCCVDQICQPTGKCSFFPQILRYGLINPRFQLQLEHCSIQMSSTALFISHFKLSNLSSHVKCEYLPGYCAAESYVRWQPSEIFNWVFYFLILCLRKTSTSHSLFLQI